MSIRRLLMPLAMACAAIFAQAGGVGFDEAFCDSTLRLDYIIGGKQGDVGISLGRTHKYAGWAGRKGNLDKLLLKGNGDITVTTMAGDTAYCNSFSSLFNEWYDLGEAAPRHSECPLLIPMPKDSVRVSVKVRDKRGETIAQAEHIIAPADILIRDLKEPPLPHRYLHRGAYAGQRVGVAVMGEGYTQQEMGQFYADAADAVDAILAHEPFAELKDRLDFIAVETPSKDSGVSVPRLGIWKNSAFQSHYSTFYMDRYLTSPEVFAMHDALRGIPAQHIIVLVNTEEYGGGGIFNSYTLTAARHPKHRPVVAHEFGHSFGGLGDEYFYEDDAITDTYPKDIEPWEPNVTTLADFGSKWECMLPPGTPVPTDPADSAKYPVGVYEGAAYSTHGVYRPADYCRMRVNDIDAFCPVCQAALRRMILYYTED